VDCISVDCEFLLSAKFRPGWGGGAPACVERPCETQTSAPPPRHAKRASGTRAPGLQQKSALARSYFLFDAVSARRRASCSRSSGVNSGPKSSASNTWRIPPSSPGLRGARLSPPPPSSIDLTCQSQKPAPSSFASEKGPSIPARFPSANLTRLPFELAWSPSPASMMPAFTSSSLYFPIFSRISRLGRTPASDSLLAFTITITRIVLSPVLCVVVELAVTHFSRAGSTLYSHGEGASAGSTRFEYLFLEGIC